MAQTSDHQVAKHYNALPERTLKERAQSRIFYLRNLNNWMKSMLIQDALDRLRSENGRSVKVTVLDLCCGKGGDLLKWKNGRIDHLVCADIAHVSVEQCKERLRDMRHRARHERRTVQLFDAEFITADCGVEDLSKHYRRDDMRFDLCSCQFSLHYCFETQARAEQLLANACGRLKVGAYFIGTVPDANIIVHLLRSNEDHKFANEICSLEPKNFHPDHVPLFGACYDFHLHEVVNCPEYLVYFPLLAEMLERHGMQLVYKLNFAQMIHRFAVGFGQKLMARMQALEPYPRPSEDLLAAKSKSQYTEADKKVQELMAEKGADDQPVHVGTISSDEWSVACLYLAFMFKKVK